MSSDRSDVTIEIFGKPTKAAELWELADAASNEGVIDWESGFDRDEFFELLEEAAQEGRALLLTRSDTIDVLVMFSCKETASVLKKLKTS